MTTVTPTPSTRRLGPDDWELYKALRLRSLEHSPDAFGSTLEREQGFTESDWRGRLQGPMFVSYADHRPVALGGGFLGENAVMQIWAMWTDPQHLRQGHARRILDELVAIADAHGFAVHLDVAMSNPVARTAYANYGFVETNKCHPLREGSSIQCMGMVLKRD